MTKAMSIRYTQDSIQPPNVTALTSYHQFVTFERIWDYEKKMAAVFDIFFSHLKRGIFSLHETFYIFEVKLDCWDILQDMFHQQSCHSVTGCFFKFELVSKTFFPSEEKSEFLINFFDAEEEKFIWMEKIEVILRWDAKWSQKYLKLVGNIVVAYMYIIDGICCWWVDLVRPQTKVNK